MVHAIMNMSLINKLIKRGDFMGEVVDLTKLTLGSKIDKLFELRNKKGEIQAVLNDLNKEIDELEYVIIQDMEAVGLDKMATDSGTVSRTVRLYPKIEDMDTFIKWCVDNDMSYMIQKRVNEGAFREYFEQNNMFPDGLDAYEKSTLNVRRSR